MTNKEIILGVMKEHPCVTSNQIHTYGLYIFKETILPRTATAILRDYANKGLVACSKHPYNNHLVYWLTDRGKEELYK